MAGNVVHANGQNFDAEVLKHDGLVFVDFYADWCGPCRMIAPYVEQLSTEMTGVKFVKVDTEQAQDLAAKYGIMSIPTLMLFKNGQLAGQATGAMPKGKLKDWIERHK